MKKWILIIAITVLVLVEAVLYTKDRLPQLQQEYMENKMQEIILAAKNRVQEAHDILDNPESYYTMPDSMKRVREAQKILEKLTASQN